MLDSLPEDAYQDIVQLASTLCDTPAALITLIDRDRQWFKARTGFDGTETSRDIAVCDHAIRTPGTLMEIEDLTQDARFSVNPFVNGEQGDTRFYAGMPLVTPDGAAIGTVCVLDDEPRQLTDEQRRSLQSLARLTMTLLEARAKERELEHGAFIAGATPAAIATPAADATDAAPVDDTPYLLALVELQDMAGTVARLGERNTDKLLQQLDAALEQTLPPGGADAVNRSSGSGEYVVVLHGSTAGDALARLRATIDAQTGAQGLRFLVGTAEGRSSESPGAVFLRAETSLLDARAAAG